MHPEVEQITPQRRGTPVLTSIAAMNNSNIGVCNNTSQAHKYSCTIDDNPAVSARSFAPVQLIKVTFRQQFQINARSAAWGKPPFIDGVGHWLTAEGDDLVMSSYETFPWP